MPVLGYFVVVGTALLGMLFAANAYMPKPRSPNYASNFDGLPASYKGEPSSKRRDIAPQIASVAPVAETTGVAPAAEPKPAPPPQPAAAAAPKPAKQPRKVVHRRQRQDDDDWSGGSYNRRDVAFGSRDPFSSYYRDREPSWHDSWASGEFEQPRVSRRATRYSNDYWSFR
jgi:hypothetical protein